MNSKLFEKETEYWHSIVEENLAKTIPIQQDFPPVIFDAMRYSLFQPCKRLRPIALLSACHSINGEYENAIPFAMAIEMIHTYSLIHDDLPAMDNDDFRRGTLTNHKMFGEDIAILAGDGLLTYSAEYMSKYCLDNLKKENILAMHKIMQSAGIQGMLAGQVADVYYENKEVSNEILNFIHINKTAKMISVSFEVGAIIGQASDEICELYRLAGEKLGMAFQIIDDVLDVTSTTEVLGKPVGSDEKNNKTTYVTLFGIEQSKDLAKTLTYESIDLLRETQNNVDFLINLSNYLLSRIN